MLSAPALACGGAALAQQNPAAPKQKGPLVWLDLDQAELDAAYTQSVYAPNIAQVQARYTTNSEIVRATLGAPRQFAYGPSPAEKLVLFPTKAQNAPINIMVHGGAWRTGSAAQYSFAAETFVRAGAHFVVLDFASVDETQGDLTKMVDQVRRAVAWVYRNAESFGGDPSRLYLCGHSSGSHLAGVVLVTDWSSYELPNDIVKGALLCSGMYDMKPVRLSVRSSYVKFDDASEDALSAQRHLDRFTTPVVLLYGDKETPEFQRQSRDFHAALTRAGKPSELIVGRNYNHFELVETLANPYGIAGRAVLAQMGL